MSLRLFILAAALLLLPCFAARAPACQCRERRPPCSQYAEADAVFVGSVADVTPVDRELAVVKASNIKRVGFKVGRAFRGVEGARAELIDWGTSCDIGFDDGETYLVYAYRNSETGALSTNYCTRTAELSKASADLAYLDGLASAAPGTLITGRVADYGKRLAGVGVTAEGEGGLHRAASDEAGWFELAVPKPGKYKVRIYLPPDVGLGGTGDLFDNISGTLRTRRHYVVMYDVEVRAGGCSFLDVPLYIFPKQ